MKNNLILGVQGLKKVLKGMFFVATSVAVVGIDAKPMGAARPQQTPTQGVRQAGTTITSAKAVGASAGAGATTMQQKAVPANLSSGAKIAWNKYTTASKLDNFLTQNRSTLTPNDIKELEARIQELRETEVVLAKDQELIELRKTVKRLTNLLKQMQSGQILSQLKAVATTEQQGWGATIKSYAMMPVIGTAYVLSEMAKWMTSRKMTPAEQVAYFVDFWKLKLNDLGKYPTYESKVMAVNEDIINTGAEGLTDDIYATIRMELQKWLAQEKDQYFKDNPGEKAKEELINNEIEFIRNKYNRDENNLQAYLNELRNANLDKVGISRCRAMVSEFLRTEDVLKLKREMDDIAAGQKAITTPASEPTQPEDKRSWFERWFVS